MVGVSEFEFLTPSKFQSNKCFFKCGKVSTFVRCFNSLESDRLLIIISIYCNTFHKFWKIQTML